MALNPPYLSCFAFFFLFVCFLLVSSEKRSIASPQKQDIVVCFLSVSLGFSLAFFHPLLSLSFLMFFLSFFFLVYFFAYVLLFVPLLVYRKNNKAHATRQHERKNIEETRTKNKETQKEQDTRDQKEG